MTLEVGTVVDDKYRIVRLLGEGGMGSVFEGENVRIHRRVAIKVLLATHARDQATVQRFEREAQAAGRIGNDHIVEIVDLGWLPGGERYLVMEYLDGESLSARIERAGRLRPDEIAPLMAQALAGLAAAHEAGIVHRDLKPDNLFILRHKAGITDFVKIIDFGISKFHQTGDGMHMTQTGVVLGTPYYMAPEQARGQGADQRSDIYALGVMMYQALSGRRPFEADTFNQLLFKIVLSDAEPLSQVLPSIDPGFEAIVQKAMAREPSERYASAAEMGAALEAWRQGVAPVPLSPPRAVASSAAELAAPTDVAAPKSRGLGVALAAVISVVLVAGVAAAVLLAARGPSDEATPAPSLPSSDPVASAAVVPTPSLVPPPQASTESVSPVASTSATAPRPLGKAPPTPRGPRPSEAPVTPPPPPPAEPPSKAKPPPNSDEFQFGY